MIIEGEGREEKETYTYPKESLQGYAVSLSATASMAWVGKISSSTELERPSG